MDRWLIFRTYHNDDATVERFNYLSTKLGKKVSMVWLFDGDNKNDCSYPHKMPDNATQFANTDLSIRSKWPSIFDTYDQVPKSTPRMFSKDGEKFSLKWVLGHLCILQWWVENGRPDGRFITWEDDIWWDRDFDPVKALEPAFRHKKFLATMVKKRDKFDSPQPPVFNPPKWFKESMICHDCISARSSPLMHALEDFSNSGAWGQVEVVVPSVAASHPTGGGAAKWKDVAMDAKLLPIMHRFEGQKEKKSPQRLFKI
jgi:hypothetical protein